MIGLSGGLRLFFELIVAFIGRRLVVHRVGFLFVDGFFFERAGSGEDGSVLLVRGCGQIGRLGTAVGFDFSFVDFVLLDGGELFAGPAESGDGRFFWTTEFLIPVG